MGFRIKYIFYTIFGETVIAVAGSWFNPEWVQSHSLLLILAALFFAIMGGLWDHSIMGRFFTREKPTVKAARWEALAENITTSLAEFHTPLSHPTMHLPRSASDDERRRTWAEGTNRMLTDSQRSLNAMKSRHLVAPTKALKEIENTSRGNTVSKGIMFTTNTLGWEDAARYLAEMATQVYHDQS